MENGLGFDLKALEVFAAIVETGGMTAAGQRLGITQSSVSQTLAALEQSLKVQLLDRSLRPPVLTPLGREFYARASLLLAQAQAVSREFRQPQATPLALVRIALVDSLATSIGVDLINAVKFRAAHWSMITGQSHRHAELLRNREADIIMSDDSPAAHVDWYQLRLLREPFVLVLPRQFNGPLNSLKQLAGALDFVRYSQGTVIGQRIEAQLQSWNIRPPLRLQLDNSYAIFSLVKAGAGFAITTPLCLLQSGLGGNDVQFFPIPEGEFYRELTLTARQHELGSLPRELAEDSVALLRQRMLPALQEHMPWLLPSLRLGPG
ncbi:LysR family transcriptional regulator [Permianibacter sp. IMCC34836]|uniref:LysR family transcriptional regulator n=1 Tax=Permianibacter fluminis TaxID=2738515 RepID=UPI0015549343|nr:LysR family transcriptional regulator [Permianibacter fluminis]NQD37817.1 LysR family transcriptional regulator [Permianibacter fluminis]